ncbi:MAG TPA: hypothetical protein VIX87_07775 [Steroidobacteraceae bacterium]
MAGELILILCDYFPRADAAAPESAQTRLPALEMILARADHSLMPQGWRSNLGARFATPALTALSPAATAARAWLPAPPAPPPAPAAPAPQHWLATPVHYFAGLDSVHLHPAGLLQLPGTEQSELVTDFRRVFGSSPWVLHALDRRDLLLGGDPLGASADDPAQFLGRDPSEGLPRGEAAATLRRLGVEIEMWLHEHPINLARLRRGELPVTALWLWGASPGTQARADAGRRLWRAAHPDAPAGSSRLLGQDLYAEALWRLQAARTESLPADFESACHAGAGAGDVLVLYPTLGALGLGDALQRLERNWVAPALAALRAGRLLGLELLAGSSAYRLRRRQLARLWRAPAPWWERLV